MIFLKNNPMIVIFYSVVIVLTCILSITGRGSEQLITNDHKQDYNESAVASNHILKWKINLNGKLMNKIIEYNNQTFEDIKHIDEYGNEYWEARELQLVLEYREWRKFR